MCVLFVVTSVIDDDVDVGVSHILRHLITTYFCVSYQRTVSQYNLTEPLDESEENLHSFQGNEAGQDLDYEPGLEFDDTELEKAAIELANTGLRHSDSNFYLYNNNLMMSSTDDPATMVPNDNDDGDIADASLITIDDEPLFSLDPSQYNCDADQQQIGADKTVTSISNDPSPSPPDTLAINTLAQNLAASIYLPSPDELLDENFEEALKEQYCSLGPASLEPVLEATPACSDVSNEDESFEDIACHGIVGVAGDDRLARKIITIYACRLPSNKTFDYAKFLR